MSEILAESSFIPSFDFQRVFIEPWTGEFDFMISLWTVVMGALVGAACGIIGNFLLLRRMALIGDAISHSVLPGIVVAFVLFKTTGTVAMFIGALAAAVVTVILINFIERNSRVKSDAATCVVFTTLFALGVVMTQLYAAGGAVHLDAECILYGQIDFIGMEPMVSYAGRELAPAAVLRILGVMLAELLIVAVFYKELLVTSFDMGLSKSMGFRSKVWNYGLMIVLALVVVSAFEAVGAVMVVAMLIVPPMFAAQLSQKLPVRIIITLFHAMLSSFGGYHLAVWLHCSIAGAMVVFGSFLFLLAWGGTLACEKMKFRTKQMSGVA